MNSRRFIVSSIRIKTILEKNITCDDYYPRRVLNKLPENLLNSSRSMTSCTDIEIFFFCFSRKCLPDF